MHHVCPNVVVYLKPRLKRTSSFKDEALAHDSAHKHARRRPRRKTANSVHAVISHAVVFVAYKRLIKTFAESNLVEDTVVAIGGGQPAAEAAVEETWNAQDRQSLILALKM